MKIKDFKYNNFNSVSPLYLIICKINDCFNEINRNKYLTLILTNESKEIMKK